MLDRVAMFGLLVLTAAAPAAEPSLPGVHVVVAGPDSLVVGRTATVEAFVLNANSAKSLARLAIFAHDEKVRAAAFQALIPSRDGPFADVLAEGLRYPWPDVARRSAEAVGRLKRTDLVPNLIEMLERPDPRLPLARDGQLEVRELVRIDHSANCLLCHEPASPNRLAAFLREQTADANLAPPFAPVALPGQARSSPLSAAYYQPETPADLRVSFDVTYLRQDFSVYLNLASDRARDARRFDFVVRTRTVTAEEAASIREQLRGDTSYRDAAHAALRTLTGRSAPTADEWRKIVNERR